MRTIAVLTESSPIAYSVCCSSPTDRGRSACVCVCVCVCARARVQVATGRLRGETRAPSGDHAHFSKEELTTPTYLRSLLQISYSSSLFCHVELRCVALVALRYGGTAVANQPVSLSKAFRGTEGLTAHARCLGNHAMLDVHFVPAGVPNGNSGRTLRNPTRQGRHGHGTLLRNVCRRVTRVAD
jgi:hypothetical protein